MPLADSLSSYKLVAIATAGGDLFGTGSASIRTVQDLTLYSGVPPLVRTGDEYGATFTLGTAPTGRWTSPRAPSSQPAARARAARRRVTVPGRRRRAGDLAADRARRCRHAALDGLAPAPPTAATDRVQVEQQVAPAVPVETWAATFLRIGPAPVPGRAAARARCRAAAASRWR